MFEKVLARLNVFLKAAEGGKKWPILICSLYGNERRGEARLRQVRFDTSGLKQEQN